MCWLALGWPIPIACAAAERLPWRSSSTSSRSRVVSHNSRSGVEAAIAAGGDLDLDGDGGVAAPEAAERVGEEVDAGGGGGAEMDRPGLQPCECIELLFAGAEAGECLGGAGGEDLPGLGQVTAAAAAFDESLSGCGLEQAEMLARARLADPDRGGRGRDAALALDLDQQAHASRVPELA